MHALGYALLGTEKLTRPEIVQKAIVVTDSS